MMGTGRGRGRGRGGRGWGGSAPQGYGARGGSFSGGRMRGGGRRLGQQVALGVDVRQSSSVIAKTSHRPMNCPCQQNVLEESLVAAGLHEMESGTKLYVSNLDYGVCNHDIWELFSDVGELKRYAIHFDNSGRPSGSAEVIFAKRSDALAAHKRYNNIQLDGKPMKIEVVIPNAEVPTYQRPINIPWQQNLLEESLVATGLHEMESGTKLYVSNLDSGVCDNDIRELFSDIGELKRYAIHFDKSGRPSGSAEVIFAKRSDAFAAHKRYNNIQLDGKPMKIEIVIPNAEVPAYARFNMVGGASGKTTTKVVMMQSGGRPLASVPTSHRRFGQGTREGLLNGHGCAQNYGRGVATVRGGAGLGRGQGQGRGSGRSRGRGKKLEKSAEELDNEVESYHTEGMNVEMSV